MGMNMARRLMSAGHNVTAYNNTPDKVNQIIKEGADGVFSLEELVKKLKSPKIVWLMLPIGKPVESTIDILKNLLSAGDIIIEGGNSFFKDDIHRYAMLKEKGIHYIDAGVSGGIWGLKEGYCTMVGGDKADFNYIEPVLKTLAPENGYMYCGGTGAGHFVKMVHNGIEYGMMEAYAEGFEILKASPYGKKLNLKNVASLWNQGSVVRSWLLELLENAFEKDPELSSISGYVEDSGEGRWTVEQAVELGVSATVLAHSVFKRFQSRQKDVFSDKILAALRNEFGGHMVLKEGESVKQSSAGAGSVTPAQPDKEYKL